MSEPTDKHLLDEVRDGTGADEQQLEEYLKGDSSVSRQYRQLHSAEVPAQLDRLVLRQAEDAVKSRSSGGRPAWVRWTAPLAVAASAVLALSIVIQTGLRDETVTAVSAPKAPQPTMQADRERVESETIEEVVVERVVPLSVVQESAAPTFAPSAPPPPPVAAPAPARPAASGRSIARSADVAARELQSMAMEPPPQGAMMHDAQQQSTAIADDLARARERKEEERSAEAKAYSRRINAEVPAAARVYSDPEAWLKDIRELRKANEQEQADREWRRFRTVFPDYEVAESDPAREAKQ